MANQSPDRRRVLEMLAKAAAASQFPGFNRWVFAGQHQHSMATPARPRPNEYKPRFFTPPEYQTIEVLTEMIIPADETPGAQDAGVSEFIDFMTAHGEEDLQPMRAGLRWLDNKSSELHGRPFLNLTPTQQTALLASLADRKTKTDQTGREFFQLVRQYAVMGYYTSRVGLEELNYPGLRLYTQSPACPHQDDPEHKHLPPPRF